MNRSRGNESLEAFVRRDPFFVVLSEPEYRADKLTVAARERFFATGREYVDAVIGTINRIAPALKPAEAVEFGCGVGRVAIPLSRHVRSVTAVDRSPAMLELARRHAAEHGANGISFLDDQTFAKSGAKYDLVNCSLVLQRMRRSEGLALVRRLSERVTPAGVLVLQFPILNRCSRLVSLTRSLRLRFRFANTAANLLLHKDRDEPLIPTTTYPINAIVNLLRDEGFGELVTLFQDDDQLRYTTVIARRETAPRDRPGPRGQGSTRVELDAETPAAVDIIDVRELIASRSIAEWNATAEAYFSSLADWEYHLAKPFATVNEAPPILINLAVLLQGAELLPGHTVVDFGGGTGWLSRFLTQLGCRVIVVDVSKTALAIAAELYERMPVVGDKPAPVFLHYDGVRIDLPDQSVDRIVSFDAFHHSPSPDAVVKDFARLLVPGGIAAFAEPGPQHSKTAQSQFEMRTYGVLENDVDVNAIWRTAEQSGFDRMTLAVFNIPPFHVDLAGFQDFLSGGPTTGKWTDLTRRSLHNVRNFFLRKAGVEKVDSRTASALRCSILGAAVTATGDFAGVEVAVRNTGDAEWLPADAGVGGVSVGCHLFSPNGTLIRLDVARSPIAKRVPPGEEARVTIPLAGLDPGDYLLEIDCVAERVAWFSAHGSRPLRIPLHVPGT